MTTLSDLELENILDNNLLKYCTEDEKRQVFAYAFGDEYIASEDKGTLKQYEI